MARHDEAPGLAMKPRDAQVGAGLCVLHVGAALMHYDRAAFDRELQELRGGS